LRLRGKIILAGQPLKTKIKSLQLLKMPIELDLFFEIFHAGQHGHYFGKMAFEVFQALQFMQETKQFVLFIER
jgi:hypothetical protein